MVPSIFLVCFVSMVMIWYPVATQDLVPLNPDNLDPAAAHVCLKTTDEPYTVLESSNVYTLAKTNTWCLSFPPRCTRYFLKSHVAYRRATRYRQRKEYYCCDGYKAKFSLPYCVPKCEFDCYSSTGQGNCILPGLCVCNHGYRGNNCESFCPEGYWGQNCTKQCNCASTGSCNPETGSCVCHIGYTGQDCSTPCYNSFGLNCVHQCVCENNSTCNNINGKCTCKPGFYGYYCQKACEAGSTQAECEDVCLCQNGGTCNENKKCVCKPGYKGDYCTETCDSNHWGQNCSSLCSCYSGRCDHVTGQCYCHIGFAGDSCERQCPPGYYGYECAIQCPCKNGGKCYYGNSGQVECNCAGTGYNGTLCSERVCSLEEYIKPGTSDTCIPCQCPWDTTDSCHPKTAICDCHPGYRGPFCQETCSKPFWGKNCRSLCGCENGDCDIETGECITCHPGYMGTNCTMPCPSNKWGANCPFDCVCENGADCHKTTGYCNCTAGFHGLTCEELCPENRYGPGCTEICTCSPYKAICNPYNGQCQCKSGYSGTQCETGCDPWKYGFQCKHDCKCNRLGTKSCDPHTGECSCKPGWKGVTCNSQCADDFWGVDCAQNCPCHPYGSCDQNTGKCLCYLGYQGVSCEQRCPPGSYGYNCSEPCPVCREGTVCNFVSGECTQQACPPGLTGVDCRQACRYGTWGDNCGKKCSVSCLQNGYCNPTNGQCTCRPGYTGSQCNSVCTGNTYGRECNSTCNCILSNTVECHHADGCQCKAGYTGTSCENECRQGFWGPECRLRCSDICESQYSTGCNPQRGLPCQCVEGHEGIGCSYVTGTSVTGQRTGTGESASAGADGGVVGLAILAAILVIIIIVVVLFFVRRQKRREKTRDDMQVVYGNQNGTIPVISANGSTVGVVNPTYEAQNSSNERRYPRLEHRATLPSPPRQQNCNEEFDEIVDAKLRVNLPQGQSTSRPTSSSHYEDVDENRYITLGSVMGGDRSSREIGISDWNCTRPDLKHKRASNDYTFYMGQNDKLGKGQMEQGQQGQMPARRSRPGSGAYVNSHNVASSNVNARSVSSPLYDIDDEIIPRNNTNQSHQDALSTCQSRNLTNNQASGHTDQTTGQSNPDITDRNEFVAMASPSNAPNNPYDIPKALKNEVQGQTSPPNGYLTPINDLNSNNPYQNGLIDSGNRSIDQNQNKLPVAVSDIQSNERISDETDLMGFLDDRLMETDTIA